MGAEPSYQLIYDAAQAGWFGLLEQLIFPLLVGGFMMSAGIIRLIRPEVSKSGRFGRTFVIFWLVAVCLLFTIALGSIIFNNARFARAAREGTCKAVEGVVADYKEGKGVRFTVASVRFDYSNADLTGGYNDSGWFTSPVQPGMRVRICYVEKGSGDRNVIVRLEIAEPRSP